MKQEQRPYGQSAMCDPHFWTIDNKIIDTMFSSQKEHA